MRGLNHPAIDGMELVTVLDALGDPVRLGIVTMLADGAEHPCVAFDFGITPASMSHHFRVLREAGLTRTRQQGRHRWITLRRNEFEARFPGLLEPLLAAARDDGPNRSRARETDGGSEHS
ncbi:ArsR/SmtB family transcription factor [Nocardia sp. alder85J]|uniref:ArsR/SmtB family transcription factor n=1 Tax=Nocardia sp. alder85J TaxID=2862949 RepID=UPI001CD685EF|nr:helix-turn-helix transcriptional regulator [Nocardia sp. alder85J]MCX4093978.1 helix-turn-helix transcriptional regulator [Nocardia sp. alder85J]